jgi:hypothetical protein
LRSVQSDEGPLHGVIGVRPKKEAYATLHNVRYTGDTKNWTSETYTNAHTASYALLSDHGEPVPESKKVRDFMLNMETSDARLLAGIAAVETNKIMMNDFVIASNFLVNFIPRNAPVAMACQIAVIESSEGSKGARSSGKKQGGGRGPCGKGANKGQGTSGLPIHNGPYTNSEWGLLFENEIDAIRKLRANKDTKQSVSAISTYTAALDNDSALGDGEHAGDQLVAQQSGKQTKYTNRTISMFCTSTRSDKDVQIMLTRSRSIVRSAAKVESNKILVGPER